MSDFKFPLETVRRLRAETEKETAGELAKARTAATAADSTREHLARLAQVSREKMQRAGGNVAAAKSVAVVLGQISRHLDAAAQRSESAWGVVEQRHEAYVEALRQRQAMDKLHDKRKEDWSANTRRREQAALDEITNQRHGQAKADSGTDDTP